MSSAVKRESVSTGTAQRRCLADLPLDTEDLDVLRHQGFVSGESRGKGTMYFKLRFRRGGKQVVIGLGSDHEAVDSIRRELHLLQRQRELDRDLNELVNNTKRSLRHTRELLQPTLQEAGYYFHGYDIRKTKN